jgi:hypothetical protein
MKSWPNDGVSSAPILALFVVVILAMVLTSCGLFGPAATSQEDLNARDTRAAVREAAATATEQALNELKAQATATSLAATREAASANGAGTDTLSGLRFLALEATGGYCFPAIGDAESQICGYHLDWTIQMPTRQTPTNITCEIKTNSVNLPVSRIGANIASTNEGSWQGSTEIGGAWPGLGDYNEVIECVVKEYDLASQSLGKEIDRVAVSYPASLATLRE